MKGMFLALGALFIISCSAESQVTGVKPTTTKDSVSYAIGASIGKNFSQQKLDINVDFVAAGIRDEMASKTMFTPEEIQTILQAFQERQMSKMNAEKAKAGEEAKKRGAEFLAKNKTQSGVMTTPSGLQYMVMKEGSGAKPQATSTVKVHYTGTLIDGKVFDSSVQRGEPIEFPLNGVIPGWTEGVQLMKVGSKYKFFIPSELGYGERGAGQDIGPNEVLVFEVELLDIVKP